MSGCPCGLRCIPDIFYAGFSASSSLPLSSTFISSGSGIGHIEFDLFTGFFEGDRKFAGLSGQAGHHGFGFNGDVGIGLDRLDFFLRQWAESSRHRVPRPAVVCANCRAMPAQIGFFFNDGYRITGLGRIQGGAHAGDSTADDQNLLRKLYPA